MTTEKTRVPIYGSLYIGDLEYTLLEPAPQKPDMVWQAQNNVLKFYVANGYAYACYVYVSGNFHIDTFTYAKTKEVYFEIEEDKPDDGLITINTSTDTLLEAKEN